MVCSEKRMGLLDDKLQSPPEFTQYKILASGATGRVTIGF